MKDSKEYAKKVTTFFKKYKGKTTLKPFESEDKVDSLVYSVLFEHLRTEDVNAFVELMRKHFVDWNDLRVSRLEEVLEVLGPVKLPVEAKKKVSWQLINCLNSLFTKYDRISFEDIEELGKRQAYQELEALNTFTPFVINFLMLNFKGSHSLPLNSIMADYARKAGIVHPESTEQEIGSFLERQIQVDDIYDFYLILRQLAETPELVEEKPVKAQKTLPGKKVVKKSPAKAVKKAAPAKAVAKKPAAKKPLKKKAVAGKAAKKK